MNAGGEPERDDFPLPPVDIDIPDDARALVREVQAYHRELRAERRRRWLRRLHAPLTRDGLVLPLLAGCLVMVMISGVLLTVFSAGQSGAQHPAFQPSASVQPPAFSSAGSSPAAGSSGSGSPAAGNSAGSPTAPVSPSPSQSAASPAVKLSAIAVLVSGRPVRLRKLLPAVLALTPADCQCGSALHQLRVQAARAHLRLYVVITKSAAATVTPLARDAGQHASGIAEDPSGALRAQLRPQGLTAAFVRSDRTVARTVRRVQAGARARLARQFRTLAAASR